MNTDRLRDYVGLAREKKALKAQIKIIEGELKRLAEPIAEEFIAEGVQSTKIDGSTIYLFSTVWAKPAYHEGDSTDSAYERACRALEAAGLEEFVHERFNTHTVSAWVRERLKEDEGWELPSELQNALAITETTEPRVRGA